MDRCREPERVRDVERAVLGLLSRFEPRARVRFGPPPAAAAVPGRVTGARVELLRDPGERWMR